jgi:translocator protein
VTLAITRTPSEKGLEKRQTGFWKQLAVAFLAAQAIGGVGAVTTELGPWYRALNKPWWQPPDWLFGPAWTAIFALAALSAVYAWRAAPSKMSRETIVTLLLTNGFLNILWSVLFFRLKRPDWALIEVGALWASVLIPILVFSRYSKRAAWLLVPYISWVTFAGILNYTIVRLNPVP